jgi:hypothetical protein
VPWSLVALAVSAGFAIVTDETADFRPGVVIRTTVSVSKDM